MLHARPTLRRLYPSTAFQWPLQ